MCAMQYQEKNYRQRLTFAERTNTLILLIAINLIIYIILAFMQAIYFLKYGKDEGVSYFNAQVLKWFVLPANVSEIGAKPWTILTHMFTHASVWHVLGNMLWLWVFGYILQDLTGNRKIFPVFLYSAFAGAVAFVLAINFLPALQQHHDAVALGASAGVMGISLAATAVAPGYRLFPMLNGGIPIWVITALYLVIDLATIPGDNPGGHIAHIAGGITGYLFIYSFQRGYDWGKWMNNFFDWVNNLFNPDKPKKGKNIRQELFYKSTGAPYKKTPNLTASRIDEILDKINADGYGSLTDEEKELLKKASKEDF